MKNTTKNLSFVIQFILVLMITGGQGIGVSAQTSAFNYQGRLTNAGANAVGAHQFEFKLFDVPTGGTPIGTVSDVVANVSDGIFSVSLDFGEAAFDGNARYLQIGVRPNGSATEYATLTPRQPITAVPYTIRAKKSAIAENLSCSGCVQSSHVNSIAGDKITGSVANADNAAKLNGLSAASYALVGGNVTFAGVSTGALSLTNNGQINNLRLENSATDPAAGAGNKGRIYFNTTTNELKMSNGAAWQTVYGVTNTTTPNPVTTRSPKQIATLNWFETPRPINFTFCDEENPNCSGVPYLTQMVFTGEHVLTAFSPPSGETTSITYDGIPTLEGIDDAGGTLGISNPNPNNLRAFSKGITYDGESVYIAYYLSSSLSQNGTGKIVKAAKKPFGSQTANGFNIAVGNNLIPFAMAFDGENVWATWKGTAGGGRVTKVSPGGVVLCNLSGFDDPRGMAFDGDNMWVANYGADNVAKIPKACEQFQRRGNDGGAARPPGGIEFFNAGTKPYAVAYDGANVWVSNSYDGTNAPASVGKYRASDGALLSIHQVGSRARGIVFDGTNIWVITQGLDANLNGTVTKLRARDGSLVGTYPVGKSPEAIVFDGLRIWVSNFGSNFITRF